MVKQFRLQHWTLFQKNRKERIELTVIENDGWELGEKRRIEGYKVFWRPKVHHGDYG